MSDPHRCQAMPEADIESGSSIRSECLQSQYRHRSCFQVPESLLSLAITQLETANECGALRFASNYAYHIGTEEHGKADSGITPNPVLSCSELQRHCHFQHVADEKDDIVVRKKPKDPPQPEPWLCS